MASDVTVVTGYGALQGGAPRSVGPWTLAWRRLRRDRVALASGVVFLAILFAVTAIEVGVTFLGAGVHLPTSSWGSLLSATWGSLLNPNPYNPARTQPWLTVIPSVAIFATVFSLNQLGEGLREALDPRGGR